MSTRGLWGFRLNAKDYLTYNHSDSYPTCLGTNLCEEFRELLKKPGLLDIIDLVLHLKLVDEGSKITEADLQRLKNSPHLDIDTSSATDWYHLLRGIQGNIGATLEIGVMIDSQTFILDSLFCEWVYIFNLDSLELEIYSGYTKMSGTGRYSENSQPDEAGYYPCTLRQIIPLNNLPKSIRDVGEQILCFW